MYNIIIIMYNLLKSSFLLIRVKKFEALYNVVIEGACIHVDVICVQCTPYLTQCTPYYCVYKNSAVSVTVVQGRYCTLAMMMVWVALAWKRAVLYWGAEAC